MSPVTSINQVDIAGVIADPERGERAAIHLDRQSGQLGPVAAARGKNVDRVPVRLVTRPAMNAETRPAAEPPQDRAATR